MKHKHTSRDNFVDEFYGVTTKEKRKKLLDAIIKIIIGIILIASGYFLPHKM